MKKKTMWISAAIAIVVAIPGVSAFAASSTSMTPDAASANPTANHQKGSWDSSFDGKGGPGKGHGGGFQGERGAGQRGPEQGLNSTHSEEYMLLLSEKYAPDQTAGFKAAYDEKTSLNKQIKELMDANKTALDQKRTDEKAKVDAIKAKVTSGELTQAQADEQIKALRDASKTAFDQKRADEKAQIDAINAKVTSGELTQAQADDQIKALKDASKPAKTAATTEEQAQRDASKTLHDQFDTAVQAILDGGSADQVTQILPKLVDDLKAQNQHTSDRLAQLKTEAAAK